LLVDALSDEHAAELLLDAIANDRVVALHHGELRAQKGGAWLPDRPEDARPVQRMGVEQSNTSVRFGARKILKWYRRIEIGPHPELEMARQLAESGFERVPPLAGWFEYAGRDGHAAAGIVQGLVHNQGDAWERMLDELGRYFERVTASASLPPAALVATPAVELIDMPVPEQVKATLGVPQSAMSKLGRRTAEMHLALARSADPAFAPEPFTPADASRLAAAIERQAHEVAALLVRRSDALDPILQPLVVRVQENEGSLGRTLAASSGVREAGARIRVHGDYHLGQVLWSEEDFFVLDFEGEPARPLDERRVKDSPLRDVAGMLRSFGYAAAVGSQAAIRVNPGREPLIGAWAAVWETWISAVFLQAYVSAARGGGIVPAGANDIAGLVKLFMIDKAFYELRYELDNRPDWAHVPLRAVADLL
jgi:trehalose synthase-fused probable maltokinase